MSDFNSPQHDGLPPGIVTATDAAITLSDANGGKMSRQLFYQSGLAEYLPRWKKGALVIYQSNDVADLATWLRWRRGMIALGLRPHDMPLHPRMKLVALRNMLDEAYYDCDCPRCSKWAMSDPDSDGPVWCPGCGLIGE